MSVAQDVVILAFSVTNACRIVAYIPQIVRLALDRGGSCGVSCWTWSLFFISNVATAVYASIVLRDSWMTIVFTANTIGSFTIDRLGAAPSSRFVRGATAPRRKQECLLA
jgi:hypothetical protein